MAANRAKQRMMPPPFPFYLAVLGDCRKEDCKMLNVDVVPVMTRAGVRLDVDANEPEGIVVNDLPELKGCLRGLQSKISAKGEVELVIILDFTENFDTDSDDPETAPLKEFSFDNDDSSLLVWSFPFRQTEAQCKNRVKTLVTKMKRILPFRDRAGLPVGEPSNTSSFKCTVCEVYLPATSEISHRLGKYHKLGLVYRHYDNDPPYELVHSEKGIFGKKKHSQSDYPFPVLLKTEMGGLERLNADVLENVVVKMQAELGDKKPTDEWMVLQSRSRKPELPESGPEFEARSQQLTEILEQRRRSAKYQESLKELTQLPASKCMQKVLTVFHQYPVIVVSGGTGCGKSTVIGPGIIEDGIAAGRGGAIEVVVCQPRRIAVMETTDRVITTNDDSKRVSYGSKIRFISKPPKGRGGTVTFMTTGVLLEQYAKNGSFGTVNVVIIDEIHEQLSDTEALMAIMRQEMQYNKKMKLILMSANTDVAEVTKYFKEKDIIVGEVTIDAGETLHSVEHVYLAEAVKRAMADGYCSPGEHGMTAEQRAEFVKDWMDEEFRDDERLVDIAASIDAHTELDAKLNVAIIKHILQTDKKGGGTVLVFLASTQEITKLDNALKGDHALTKYKPEIVYLYGKLSIELQQEAIQPVADGKWKVILATNIAETTLTIRKTRYVICNGYQQLAGWNPKKRIETLNRVQISKTSLTQRSGRTGREDDDGTVYHLYLKKRSTAFEPQVEPEMKRTNLSRLLLMFKMMGKDSSFFRQMIHPPHVDRIRAAESELKTIGALTEDGSLTWKGRALGLMPTDHQSGLLLVYGCLLKCIDPVMSVISGLEYKPPMFDPLLEGKRDIARQVKSDLLRKYCLPSDFLLWAEIIRNVHPEALSRQAREQMSKQEFVDFDAIAASAKLKNQLTAPLNRIGMLKDDSNARAGDGNSVAMRPLTAAITAGLFSNYGKFSKSKFGELVVTSEAWGSGHIGEQSAVLLNLTSQKIPPFIVVGEAKELDGGVCMFSAQPSLTLDMLLFAGRVELFEYFVAIDGWAVVRLEDQQQFRTITLLRKFFDGLICKRLRQIAFTEEEEAWLDTIIDGLVASAEPFSSR